ncbi:hypothetical protein [Synechocystis sp. PCC 7509]|uniref:hypothetical protein n=1 Tax=Synechocystis sp. PCC 7509 TaxID=927677 RepID=UPI0002ABB9B9|nr:hypothetical protein [Synechocystis sp. PCC 7509]
MVERPIKKSERQIDPPSEVGEEIQELQPKAVEDNLEATTTSPEKRKVIPSVPGKEKTKSRGKGSNREETTAPPMNMALMRGPKPTKTKPPVVAATPEQVESSSEPQSEFETAPQE